MGLFKQAVRQVAKLRLALSGPSGSGKTYSALLIASGIVPIEKVAVVDTENGSAAAARSIRAEYLSLIFVS